MAPTFCNRCGDAVEEERDPIDELAELDDFLERLRVKRYHLKRKINRFHSPIVRQLPPDVTSTIFEFCLPEFTRKVLSYTKEELSVPLSLGAICSYWRDIAWSTPSLWTSLVIRIPGKQDSHMATAIVAQEWLARTGQLPLSIRIFSESYNKTIPALADIISQYSARCSVLDLHIPDHYYESFHATDNHAPILKSIRFHCSARTLGEKKMNFQLTCPRLERAILSSFPMDETNIHWDNLTHLNLQSMSIFDSLLILRKTPRLVFCKVSVLGSSYGARTIGAPVLTSMKSLQLLISSAFSRDFLNNIIAPHLEELSLSIPWYPLLEVATSFLRRSTCSLLSFSVFFSCGPLRIPSHFDEGFNSLLHSMPSLNSLSIQLIHDNPRDLFQLVANVVSSQSTSFQQGLLPNLKTLEFTGKLYLRPGNYFDLYPLPPADNAVHGPFRLLKIDINPLTRIPEDIISYISSLVERGITVNVLCGSKDILQSSVDYYRSRKESLCRDWTDNFDSSLFS